MADAKDITVLLGGDFCPAGRVDAGLRDGSLAPGDVLGPIQGLLDAHDFRLVNLECPLAERALPIDKPCSVIRANPAAGGVLKQAAVDAVTLANNHIRDYGSDGVLETLGACAAHGLRTVGAGSTLAEARVPLVVTLNGRKVAFVNVAEQEFANATTTQAGANPLELIDLLHDLRLARDQAGAVILIVHGGLEMVHVPSPQSVKVLRFLAEQGVAAVLRHHAHVIQGYEVWKGVPIFYGVGNLLFDLEGRMPDAWYQGLLVTLRIAPDNTCRFDLHPVRQCDGTLSVRLLEGEARANALLDIERYSALLADAAALALAWAEAIRPMREHYFGLLGVPFWNLRRALVRLKLLRHFHPSLPVAMCWENLLRCDTHREVLLDLLKAERRSSQEL